MNDSFDQIFDLLSIIQKYYPVGLPNLMEGYPGYQLRQEILSKKFEDIREETPTPWTSFMQMINKDLLPNEYIHRDAMQFPGYEILIKIDETQVRDIKISSMLILNVSLLFESYTYFIVNSFTALQELVPCQVISSALGQTNSYEPKKKKILEAFRVNFPKHKYIDYNILFKYKVEGMFPQRSEEFRSRKFTIYDYLFSDYFLFRDEELLLI